MKNWNEAKMAFYRNALDEIEKILSLEESTHRTLVDITEAHLSTLAKVTIDGLENHPRAKEIEVSLNMLGVTLSALSGTLAGLVENAPDGIDKMMSELVAEVARVTFCEKIKTRWLDEMQRIVYENVVDGDKGAEDVDLSDIISSIKGSQK